MSPVRKVLLGPSTFAENDRAPLQKLLDAGFEVMENPYKRKLAMEELLELLPGVQGLIAGLEPLTRDVLEKSDLKVISRCGAGLSNIDLKAAEELGIAVRCTPDGPTIAVAELTVGCLLSLLRFVPLMDRALHKKEWVKKTGRQLSEMAVAVIGFGRIGRKVGELLRAFGANVMAVDPFLSRHVDGIPVVLLDEALRQADVITLHSSGDECLLGEREFSLMKNGIYLLNAARGSLISEEALLCALKEGKVAGAWLDTFQCEPYCGPLCGFQNVILTPHAGSYTKECRQKMEAEAVEHLLIAMGKV